MYEDENSQYGSNNNQYSSNNNQYSNSGNDSSDSYTQNPGTSGWTEVKSSASSGNGGAGSAGGNSSVGNGGSAGSGETYRQDTYYQQAPRMDYSYIPREPEKPQPKKKSMAGRVALLVAGALLFGTVAGGTMFAVNTAATYVAGRFLPQEEKVAQAPVQVQTAPATQNGAPAVTAQALPNDVSGIVKEAMPSMVAIVNTMLYEQRNWFFGNQVYEVPASGSGIIVGQNDEELLIVTNNHVVEDSEELKVTFIDGTSVNAAIKGTDSESDLAVIAVPLKEIASDTMGQIKIAVLGDSDALDVGQGVIAIGNALGYGQSMTGGYVSALDREVTTQEGTTRHLIQTDAAINPGNSGGALLNMKGEVIGINVAKLSDTKVEGMGYAIPISQAQDIINELMNKTTRTQVLDEEKQGYLGIQGQNIDDMAATMYGMPKGIFVYKIIEDGAAAKSELKEKDIITKFDGQTVRSMADLQEMLTYYEGGTKVNLTVQTLQDGQYVERTVEITLGYRPAAETEG